MKKTGRAFIPLVLLLFIIPATHAAALTYNSAGIGGATGMINTAAAKTGWEDADLAIDVGYHFIADDNFSHIPKISICFLKQAEVGFIYDAQDSKGDDFIFHVKWNFYNAGNAALAFGSNVQGIRFSRNDSIEPFGQIYFAFTYLGEFFGMPIQTSIIFGKTLGKGYYNSDLDFSMGFDLDLFPDFLQHYLHWINDFANYSYSVDPNGSTHARRGSYSTGFRIAVLKGEDQLKLNIDLLITDFFDEGDRSFAVGTTFGFAIL